MTNSNSSRAQELAHRLLDSKDQRVIDQLSRLRFDLYRHLQRLHDGSVTEVDPEVEAAAESVVRSLGLERSPDPEPEPLMAGYLCLGGGQELDLTHLFFHYVGAPVGPHRGRWALKTNLFHQAISIPARDKRMGLLSSDDHATFLASMEQLDSQWPDQPYREKLRQVVSQLSGPFVGVVNNFSTSTHHSFALLSRAMPITLIGLFDSQLRSTYLVWSTDPNQIEQLLQLYPMRFLVYRFPLVVDDALFFPIERLCSRWWRWIQRSDFAALQPFNALERHLFGSGLNLE